MGGPTTPFTHTFSHLVTPYVCFYRTLRDEMVSLPPILSDTLQGNPPPLRGFLPSLQMSLIELRAVCSAGVKKHSSLASSNDVITWTVDKLKPFNDEANFGKLILALGVYAPCELCHFFEGVVGDIIELNRTPEDLGYRPRMSVYVRLHHGAARSDTNLSADISAAGISLSFEEEQMLKKLRKHFLPNLGPDDACPLCGRLEAVAKDAAGPAAGSGAGLNDYGSPIAMSQAKDLVAFGSALQQLRPEVGIQCGNSGSHDHPMAWTFGAAARLRDVRVDNFSMVSRASDPNASLGSSPADRTSRRIGGSATGGGPSSYQPQQGGANGSSTFVDFDELVIDLKENVDRLQREKDEVCLEMRRVVEQKTELEKWKFNHRCEVSADVQKLKDTNDLLQTSLREMMRGREEALALLQQRRSTGAVMQDTPRPYAPFAVSPPSLESVRPPKSLLAQLGSGATPSTYAAALLPTAGQSAEILKRPSQVPAELLNPSASKNRRAASPQGGPWAGGGGGGSAVKSAQQLLRHAASLGNLDHDVVAKQPMGQCLLRVSSVSGEPFFVKRNLVSQIRDGRHILVLSSLDGVVTDEIVVGDVETAGTDGDTGLVIATRRFQWLMHMNAVDRQRWIHWLYALNPYLSAQTGATGGGGLSPSH